MHDAGRLPVLCCGICLSTSRAIVPSPKPLYMKKLHLFDEIISLDFW